MFGLQFNIYRGYCILVNKISFSRCFWNTAVKKQWKKKKDHDLRRDKNTLCFLPRIHTVHWNTLFNSLCALLQEYLQNDDVVLCMSDVSVNGSNCCSDVHEKWSGRGWIMCIGRSAFWCPLVCHCLLTYSIAFWSKIQ